MTRNQTLPIGLMLAVTAGLLLYPFPIEVDPAFWRSLMDTAHIPVFAVVAFGISSALPSHASRSKRSLIGLTAAIALVLSAELIQPLTGRTASAKDVALGIWGTLVGTLIFAVYDSKPRFFGTGIASALGIAGIAIGLQDAANIGRALKLRATQFPALGQFESASELYLWTPNGAVFPQDNGNQLQKDSATKEISLMVTANIGEWPGISFNAGQQNWSAYATLACDVYNPTTPFILRVRVDDDGDCSRFGMRYDREINLTNGWNNIVIPISEIASTPAARRLNVKAIRRLALFIDRQSAPRTFLLARVRLEPPFARP